jgi:hypothetical protein
MLSLRRDCHASLKSLLMGEIRVADRRVALPSLLQRCGVIDPQISWLGKRGSEHEGKITAVRNAGVRREPIHLCGARRIRTL